MSAFRMFSLIDGVMCMIQEIYLQFQMLHTTAYWDRVNRSADIIKYNSYHYSSNIILWVTPAFMIPIEGSFRNLNNQASVI